MATFDELYNQWLKQQKDKDTLAYKKIVTNNDTALPDDAYSGMAAAYDRGYKEKQLTMPKVATVTQAVQSQADAYDKGRIDSVKPVSWADFKRDDYKGFNEVEANLPKPKPISFADMKAQVNQPKSTAKPSLISQAQQDMGKAYETKQDLTEQMKDPKADNVHPLDLVPEFIYGLFGVGRSEANLANDASNNIMKAMNGGKPVNSFMDKTVKKNTALFDSLGLDKTGEDKPYIWNQTLGVAQSFGSMLGTIAQSHVTGIDSRVLLGISAGRQAYEDYLKKGMDANEAAVRGVVNGIIEGGSEFFGGGDTTKKIVANKLDDVVKKYGADFVEAQADKTFGKQLIDFIKNEIVKEGTQEALTTGAEQLADAGISAGLGKGFDNDPNTTWKDNLADMGASFYGGALMGAVGGGAGEIANSQSQSQMAQGQTQAQSQTPAADEFMQTLQTQSQMNNQSQTPMADAALRAGVQPNMDTPTGINGKPVILDVPGIGQAQVQARDEFTTILKTLDGQEVEVRNAVLDDAATIAQAPTAQPTPQMPTMNTQATQETTATPKNEVMFTDYANRINGGTITKDLGNNLYQVESDDENGLTTHVVQKTGEDTYEAYHSEPTEKSQLPMDERDYQNVSEKSVKTYAELHPELAPAIQNEANVLLRELDDTTPGSHYKVTNEMGQEVEMRQERVATDSINFIKDNIPGTYEEIKGALTELANGNAKSALAKKLEIVIDDRLMNGYNDKNTDIPANKQYVANREYLRKGQYSIDQETFDKITNGEVQGKVYQPDTQFHRKVQDMMKTLGTRVVFYKGAEGADTKGFYKNGKTIFIDANNTNGAIMQTAGHEFLHEVKANREDLYKPLMEFAQKYFGKEARDEYTKYFEKTEGSEEEIKQASDYIAKLRANGDEGLLEEMIADEMGNNFVNKAFWRDVYKHDKTLFQKLVDIAKKVIAKIEKGFGGYKTFIEDDAKALLSKKLSDMVYEVMLDNEFVTTDGAIAPTGDILYSIRTWTEEVKNGLIKEIVKRKVATENEARQYFKALDTVAAKIGENPELLDYVPAAMYEALKKNADPHYNQSVDFSTLCKKRHVLQGTLEAIQKNLGRGLYPYEWRVVRKALANKGIPVSCGACYVDSKRMELGLRANQYIDNNLKKGEWYNYKERNNGTPYPEKLPPADWFLTQDGLNKMKVQYPAIYSDFMKKTAVRGIKTLESRTEYRSDILKKYGRNKRGVEKLVKTAGLRWQSWSDFEVPHLLDAMQAIVDMWTVGLSGHAYTKVPEFVQAMGKTGLMINVSLIPKGDTGFDENGNLNFDPVEGMDYETAKGLRGVYDKTVGTISIGISDAFIKKAMNDPNIDYIIPYHSSQNSKEARAFLGLGMENWTDYTTTQNEVVNDWAKNIAAGGRWDAKSTKRKPAKPDLYEIWDYNKTPKENTDTYVAKCAEMGLTPQFPQFKDEPNYYKVLIDHRMFDGKGEPIIQKPVKPIFDTEILNSILSNYQGGHNSIQADKATVAKLSEEFKNNLEKEDAIDPDDELAIAEDYNPEQTSLPQVPATFKNKNFIHKGLNLDIGGGAYDIATDYAKEQGFRNVVFDTYARGFEHNATMLQYLKDKSIPTTTSNNVLNVIKEKDGREGVIAQNAAMVDPDGTSYFLIYEAGAKANNITFDENGISESGSYRGKGNKLTWQNVAKTSAYVPEVQKYYKNVTVKGNLIIAKEPIKSAITKGILDTQSYQKNSSTTHPLWNWYKQHEQSRETGGLKIIPSQMPKLSTGNKQIETPEFKAWFGNSKAVDKKGKPIILYHGTSSEFNTFDKEKGGSYSGAKSAKEGFFFTDNPTVADTYREGTYDYKPVWDFLHSLEPDDLEFIAKKLDYGGSLYSYDADEGFEDTLTNIQSMIEDIDKQEGNDGFKDFVKQINRYIGYLDSSKAALWDKVKESLDKGYGHRMGVYLKMENPLDIPQDEAQQYFDDGMFTDVIQRAKKEGYDGVIFRDIQDSVSAYDDKNPPSGDDYIVFEPTQIKSATNNNGDFDPNNPDIRYSSGNKQIETPQFKAWFKDSEVVDDDGKPLRVYHGTRANRDFNIFNEFTEDEPGPHFGTIDASETFVDDYKARLRPGARTYPVYLSIQNPLRTGDFYGDWESFYEGIRRMVKDELLPRNDDWKFNVENARNEMGVDENGVGNTDSSTVVSAVKNYLMKLGYDGIRYTNYHEDRGSISWIAFKSNQIKSAIGNNGNFDPNKSDIRYAAGKKQEQTPFYYKSINVIEDKMGRTGKASEILNMLKANGVKDEELDYLGVRDFLKDNTQVSKEDLLDTMYDNMIDVKEKTLKDGEWSEPTDEDYAHAVRAYLEEMESNGELEYMSYDLKNALSNYENDPRDAMNQIDLDNAISDSTRYSLDDILSMVSENPESYGMDAPTADMQTKFQSYTTHNKENYRELLFTLPKGEAIGSNYHSPHWAEDNVLAHTRLQDADNGNTLYVEEVQSDWHQEGRDKGYQARMDDLQRTRLEHRREVLTQKASKLLTSEAIRLYGAKNFKWNMLDRAKGEMSEELKTEYNDLESKIKAIDNALKGVQDAPFKKTWQEFVLKKIFNMAVQDGYKRVEWTSGDIQNKRYDLSNTVGKVEWVKFGKDHYGLKVYRPGETEEFYHDEFLTGSQLDGVIGRELAEKVRNGQGWTDDSKDGKESYGELSGDGLQVGGSGMKGFYDKMIPDFVRKYGKKWGINVERRGDSWGFDVTDKMRQDILQNGQPMFAKGQKQIQKKESILDRAGKAIKGYQYIGMLANLATGMNNTIGNAGAQGIDDMDKTYGALADLVVSQFTKKRAVLPPNPKQRAIDTAKGIKEDWDNIFNPKPQNPNKEQGLTGGTTFANGVMGRIERINKFINSDTGWYDAVYNEMMRDQQELAKMNNVPLDKVKAQKIANLTASYLTWRDSNWLSRMVKKFEDAGNEAGKGGYGLGTMIFRFGKTAANIGMYGVTHNPAVAVLQAFGGIVYDKLDNEDGDLSYFDQAKFSKRIGKAMTGATLMGVAYALAGAGILGTDDDKDYDVLDMKKDSALPSYYFNFTALTKDRRTGPQKGDFLISVDWMIPLSPIMIGGIMLQKDKSLKSQVDVAKLLVKAAEGTAQSAVTGVFNNLYPTSLDTFRKLLDGIYRAGDEIKGGAEPIPAIKDALGKTGQNMLVNEAGAFIPRVLQQLRNAMDSTQRETYDPSWGKELGNKLINKLPGLSKNLPPKLDYSGKPISVRPDVGNTAKNIFDSFENPSKTGTYNPDPSEQKLLDIYHATGKKNIIPVVPDTTITLPAAYYEKGGTAPKIKLSAKQYQDYQKALGEKLKVIIQGITYNTKDMTSKDALNYAKAIADQMNDAEASVKEDMAYKLGYRKVR